MDGENLKGDAPMASQRPMSNSEQAEPGVVIPRSAARTAIRQAEQAADEINARLRDAEQRRDDLARQLGAQQEMVDRLLSEREYRTRHVRNLQAAIS